jgi:hypothetical protein
MNKRTLSLLLGVGLVVALTCARGLSNTTPYSERATFLKAVCYYDSLAVATTPQTGVVVTLPSAVDGETGGVNAAGCDLATLGTTGGTIEVTLSTGDSFSLSRADYLTPTFAGFITDPGVTITTLKYASTPENEFRLSDFVYGTTVMGSPAVPEPLTMTGVFLALGGLGAYLRKRARA